MADDDQTDTCVPEKWHRLPALDDSISQAGYCLCGEVNFSTHERRYLYLHFSPRFAGPYAIVRASVAVDTSQWRISRG